MEKKIDIGGVFEKAFERCSNEIWNAERCTGMIIQFIVAVMESGGKGSLGIYLDTIAMFSTGRPIGTVAVRVPKKYFVHPNVRFNLKSKLEEFGFHVDFETVGGNEMLVLLVISRMKPKYDVFEDIEKGLEMAPADGEVKGETTIANTAPSLGRESLYESVNVAKGLDRTSRIEMKELDRLGKIETRNSLSKKVWNKTMEDLQGGKDDKYAVR